MLGRGALALRAGGVIGATMAVAIAFALILAFLKFEQRMLIVTTARLELVLEEVRQQTETGLALGLELGELQDLAAVLKRAAVMRDVGVIDIWDNEGLILFSTGADRIGTHAARTSLEGKPGQGTQVLGGEQLILTAALTNAFGQEVGRVAVFARLSNLNATSQEVLEALLTSSAQVIALAVLVTLVAVMFTIWLTLGRSGHQGDQPHYVARSQSRWPRPLIANEQPRGAKPDHLPETAPGCPPDETSGP